MADSHYISQAAHSEPGQHHEHGHHAESGHHHEGHHHHTAHHSPDPRTPRTDAMSAAASGTLPPEEPSHHHSHGAVRDPGPQPGACTAASPPEGNLPHGEHRHRGWSERMHELGLQAADPINALANKVGSQAFLPSTMDKECEKAASILLSFCKEGAHGEGHHPRSRDRALLSIPARVLQHAVGLAIFTAARAGFEISAATGSGILIARGAEGAWGAPSGIQVHTLGAGFLAGADIYDCVCVINTREALETFARTRVSLGPEIVLAAGPFGCGGRIGVGAGTRSPGKGSEFNAETDDPARRQAGDTPAARRRSSHRAFGPVFTYVKSRGLFAGVHMDGTVITERREANAAFYGKPVSVSQILTGEDLPAREAPHLWPIAARGLHEALRRAGSGPEEEIVQPTEATPAINDPKPGHGMGDWQGQGGNDPVPRADGPKTGTVSGAAHKTTDELPSYEGKGDRIRGQKAPEPGQEMAGTVPREGQEKKGTVGGEEAHATSDELPGYPGPKAKMD